MKSTKRAAPRKFSEEFKAMVLEQAANPKTTAKEVADKYEIHANQITSWRRGRGYKGADDSQSARRLSGFVELPLKRKPSQPQALLAGRPDKPIHKGDTDQAISIELTLQGLHLSISWPVTGMRDCANWLEGLIKQAQP